MLTSYKIGGYEFSLYWTVFFLGILLMFLMNLLRSRSYQLKLYVSIILTMLVVVVSFVGAKILYYIENPQQLIQNGITFGGVSFFGSVYLVPIVMCFICKKIRMPYDKVMDFLSPSLMLMLAVLRVGCLLSGCCGGISGYFAGFYVEKFPTQIVECIFDLMIMAGLFFYDKFWDNEGRLYYFIMVYYGIVRFMIEFVRDTPKDWFYMSHGQWFAIAAVSIGGYMLYHMGKMERKVKRKRR